MLRTRPLLAVAPVVAACLLGSAASAHAQQGAPAPAPAPAPVQVVPQPQTVIIQQPYPAPMYQAPVYPPQGYPQAQPYYAPQPGTPGAPTGPRVIHDWDDSQPAPAGYHQESHVRKGLVIGGAVTFGVTYFFSALAASITADANSGNTNPAAALWVPALGPFIQMTHGGSATGNFFLALDGLAQVGGVTMFAIGIASPKTELVRNDFGLDLRLAPIVAKDQSGMALIGRF